MDLHNKYEMHRKIVASTPSNKCADNRYLRRVFLFVFSLLFTGAINLSAADVNADRVSDIDQTPQQTITVTGVVKDADGETLPGVAIVLQSNKQIGQSTDINGKYIFTNLRINDKLLFTYIGMEPFEVTIRAGKTVYDVTMQFSAQQLEGVVVETGIFQRDRASFTGAISTYAASELKMVGNQNVIESLKVLDPAFVVLDNLDMGSNPNALSTIELRGQGSATINAIKDEFSSDPNQPLFVLNGVETSYTRIKDLDINRVQSITILKDAGSTAIYGSKGANGVVVIETIKPKPGMLRLYYGGNYIVAMPDLTVFNLMNAAEKLEFERLSGKFTAPGANTSPTNSILQKNLTDFYNSILADVKRGVDTYWMNEPLRTGFTHGHSLRVTGGDDALNIDVGVSYKTQEGVMKTSGRDTWGGDIGLTYRKGKINASNFFDISGYTGRESAYGNFSDWSKASPYYRKGNDQFLQKRNVGDLKDNDSPFKTNVPNPLWNAKLNSKGETINIMFTNSFFLQYLLTETLRFKGGLDLTKNTTKKVAFTDPEHTKYYEKSIYERGEYSEENSDSFRFRLYADAAYSNTINKLHAVTMFVRGQIEQTKSDFISIAAEGFPAESKGSPNLAHSYKKESKPGYSLSDKRGVSLKGVFNYSYDRRYMVDFTYGIDGATTFGSNKLYKSFWSAGIGWNIDKEAFMKDHNWIEMLKLRATTGLSGNQNQGSTVSETVYRYMIESNIFGQGLNLSEFANPDLPWQTAFDYGIGIDFRAMRGRIMLTADYYKSKTDPNIVFVPQIPSTGIGSYPMGIGHLTKEGLEFVLAFHPVYNLKKRIMWGFRITGLKTKSKYGGLGRRLDIFNENQRKSNTLAQYRDGYSPTDIWAVRSYGIDPADGKEIFINKYGKLTKDYNYDDITVVGNIRPDIMGVISTNFRYKDFYLNIAFRYSYGGDIYNDALFNKVENITREDLQYNQDKRALYDRWKKPGDISRYKSISILADGVSTYKTSRFVQKNNYLNAESISFSYELNNNAWIEQYLAAKTLKITAYFNDIFRLETSKTERGINYPFARSVSMGLNLSF